VAEDGCVLVRPDAHVAWRSAGMVDDPADQLVRVLSQVLDR
jgi:2,4-dichlorophenol 6-monooxygenase